MVQKLALLPSFVEKMITRPSTPVASSATIGIPRALLYHRYAPLWTTFFRLLGCKVIISPNSNRQLLERGIEHAVDENCLAVKIFLGHVDWLLERAGYIFIPYVVALHPKERMCVKLFAMGDIVRNTFPNARILEYCVDADRNQLETDGLIELGMRFNPDRRAVKQVVRQAQAAQEEQWRAEIEKQTAQMQRPADCRVLVVAHRYIMRDALMGKMVTRILTGLGVDVIDADIVEPNEARTRSAALSASCYWTYSKELLGGIEIYRKTVDGILFLMAFPCGPDALMINLCQLVLQDLPLSVLTLDELQGDAGLKTRLESFVDILRFRKEGAS